MRILLVGNGGREHAIAWSLSRSRGVTELYVAPGNGGTATLPRTANVPVRADDTGALLDFATARQIELTVVGPEAPLVAGVADAFLRSGVAGIRPHAGSSND